MYIDRLELENFRCFAKQSLEFMHPDSVRASDAKFPNINVVLGANGAGKTTLLRAIALATLNPLVKESGFIPVALTRNLPNSEKKYTKPLQSRQTRIQSRVILHWKSEFVQAPSAKIKVEIQKMQDGETSNFFSDPHIDLQQMPSDAFLAVGYGSTRRVERPRSYEYDEQNKLKYRYLRLANLFESRTILKSLESWLPALPRSQRTPVFVLLQSLMPKNLELIDNKGREFLHHKIRVPFDALADGHRSYIGWISDLLYHLHRANPRNVQDVQGVVLVDEVDLLAHPKWQRELIPLLSKNFPRLQFVLTTHSPIVAASVEAANLFILETGRNGTAKLRRPSTEVYGLNAQQVLYEFFGMDSTRAVGFERQLDDWAKRSREGDQEATQKLIDGLAFGAGQAPKPQNNVDLGAIQQAAKNVLGVKP